MLFILVEIICAQTLMVPPGFHEPFWRQKKDVQTQMLQKDLIVVSATTGKIENELYEMKVVAGGVVSAPFDFTAKAIQKYETLPLADSHFKNVKWDTEKNILYLHMAALGYHAKMNFKIQTQFLNKKMLMVWECVDGHFKGMKGVLEVVELERQKSEISMTAEYRASKLPLPQVLMGPGLEAIGKITAYKLRQFISTQYRD